MTVSRRDVLGIAAGLGPAACSGGSGGPAGSGETYAGPKVDLTFWNGFTGGDGPFMKKLVAKFNAEHKDIWRDHDHPPVAAGQTTPTMTTRLT